MPNQRLIAFDRAMQWLLTSDADLRQQPANGIGGQHDVEFSFDQRRHHADLVRDMPFDVGNYLMATNSLRRVLETLGLARVAKDVGTTVFRIIGGLPPPPMQTQSNGSLSLPEKESVV